MVVELAFDASPFVLEPTQADRIVRVRTATTLWHKERLLNIALEQLPDGCDKVAWLDADVLFENGSWVEETSRMLEEYVVVQPFDTAWWLPPGATKRTPPCLSDENDAQCQPEPGLAYTMAKTTAGETIAGHPGLAWAARRSVMLKHGFYDRSILGGGDAVLAWAMYGRDGLWPGRWSRALLSLGQISDITAWSKPFYGDVRGSVFYTPGSILHLWHGAKENRHWADRSLILKAAKFDPQTDVSLDSNGCWQWSSDKPELHRKVRDFFWLRKEEG